MTLQQRAHHAVREAILSGRLVRLSCEAAGDHAGRIEGHHDDYSQPLTVRWLCQRHHRLLHAPMRRLRATEKRLEIASCPPQLDHQFADQFRLRRDALIDRQQAAQLIGVSTRTLDRLIDAGELRYVGSTHRLSKSAVWAFVHGSHSRRRMA